MCESINIYLRPARRGKRDQVIAVVGLVCNVTLSNLKDIFCVTYHWKKGGKGETRRIKHRALYIQFAFKYPAAWTCSWTRRNGTAHVAWLDMGTETGEYHAIVYTVRMKSEYTPWWRHEIYSNTPTHTDSDEPREYLKDIILFDFLFYLIVITSQSFMHFYIFIDITTTNTV